jgi:hypothetical protein
MTKGGRRKLSPFFVASSSVVGDFAAPHRHDAARIDRHGSLT